MTGLGGPETPDRPGFGTAIGFLALALATMLALVAGPPLAAAQHAVVRSAGPAVVEMRVAALIMSGQQGGPLPIAVAVLPRFDTPRTATAMVEIDGAALLEASSGEAALLVEVFAYVLASDLDVIDQQSLSLRVDPADHRELLAGTGLKAFLPVRAPSGDYRLRVLARVGETFGLRGTEVAILPGDGEALRLPPPIFHELDEPWLLAVPASGAVVLPPSFGLFGSHPLPTSRPLLAEGAKIAAEIFTAGRLGAHFSAQARLRRPGGDVFTVPLTITRRSDDASQELAAVTVSFDSAGLGHGPYELAVTIGPEASAEAAEVAPSSAESSYVPLLIEAAPDLSAPVADSSERPAEVETPTRRAPLSRAQRELRRKITSDYRRALRQLASGQERQAQEILHALETRAVQLFEADAIAVLTEGEATLFVSLEDAEWDCVLPVILLHLDLSRRYRETRQFILARHATRMAVELATTYAQRLATPRAASEAARALTSLAGHFQHRGALTQAHDLFAYALALADDPSARLGIATLHEKRGHFDQALPALEALVKARPEHLEGRLRLALNRYRTGDVDGARSGFERLSGKRKTEWVALLAHQELARLEVDQGRLPRAATVLRRGLERWRAHPTLTLQLASVLDAQGEMQAARQLLENLDLSSAAHPAGERSRYNQWPEDLLITGRRELAAEARRRLPRLTCWLDSLTTAGPG